MCGWRCRHCSHGRLGVVRNSAGTTPGRPERSRDECGSPSLQDVGDRLVCETGRPSRLVDATVRAGWLHRDPDAADRRRISLTLTAEGRRVLLRARAVEQTLHEHISAVVAPGDIDVVIGVLRALTAHLPAGRSLLTRTPAPAADA